MGKGKRNRADADDLTDPRTPGGNLAGPGGPAHMDGVVVDTNRAVLLDGSGGVLVHVSRDGEEGGDAFGLILEGRINRTTDRAKVLYLTDLDGLVAVICQGISLAGRSGVPIEQLMSAIDVQLKANHEAYLADLANVPENER